MLTVENINGFLALQSLNVPTLTSLDLPLILSTPVLNPNCTRSLPRTLLISSGHAAAVI